MARGVASPRHVGRRLGCFLAVVATFWLGGCGVVLDAPKVSLLVREDQIVYVGGSGDEAKLVGGETVLRVSNDSGDTRQIVLARLGQTSSIPLELLEAESPRDDERILGMSHELEPKKSTFASGGFGYEFDTASFHVYLAPGDRYVLFDRLGGYEDGVVLEFVPLPDQEPAA